MNNRPILSACSLSLTLALCVVSGCTSAPQSTDYRPHFAYQIERAPAQIDASASVEASATLTPEMRLVWKTWVPNDQKIDAYMAAIDATLTHDIVSSGLFSRIQQLGEGRPDYVVRIDCEESDATNFRIRVTMRVFNATTGQEIYTQTEEALLGLFSGGNGSISLGRTPDYPPDVAGGWSGLYLLTGSIRSALPQMTPALKSGLAMHLENMRNQPAAIQAAQAMQTATLSELLAIADKSVNLARERNRVLVAAKNHQLPTILRDAKTDELTALVVKIEQTILDLNHECEVTKDQAQQSLAGGTPGNSDRPTRGGSPGTTATLDELRGLAICYRERIELLKPILAALKEEIANRNR